ncbi:MAG TPA: pilus assembly protein PilP [Thermodesulfobacteriota bacterium]|nr:pilus assembly protein PilP [Thermodesulfobacteriota bacterium]
MKSEKITKILVFVTIFVFGVMAAMAEEVPGSGASSQDTAYDPSGKRDPFKPFIKLTEKEKETKPSVSELIPPIQRYSLEEFKLVGVLWMQKQPKAMIVDPEKNTYVLSVGDEIGNMQGRIVEIRNNGILVQEKKHFENIFGEKKVETATSVLAFRE